MKEIEKISLMKRINECEEQISTKEKEISELRKMIYQKDEQISQANIKTQEKQEQIEIISIKLQNSLNENNMLKASTEEQQLLHQDEIRYSIKKIYLKEL